ncbi:MAG: di-heme oxidoredictase family protein, partial [Polyangiales bacterium]
MRDDPTDLPVAGLSPDEAARFDRGDARFSQVFRASQGLGPVYIRASCAACHAGDGRGPGFVERAVAVGPDGYTPLEGSSAFPYGPVLRPYYLPPATRGVEPDEGAELLRSTRVGPPVFARGWIAAVSDEAIVAAAEREAREGRVRGRVARLDDGRVGRFGLKARVATLEAFTADAFVSDMGLTSPARPVEVPNAEGVTDDARPGVDLTADDIDDVSFYVRALALPRREGLTDAGRAAFARAGCADCHAPSLATRPDARPAVMAGASAELYSDLLLHDMGVGLADGAREGAAGPRDWRTAPLVGLRFARRLM